LISQSRGLGDVYKRQENTPKDLSKQSQPQPERPAGNG
jgi:hypothetical protein